MRTTITLDADTRGLIEKFMSERGLSFKESVNEAIRRGLAPAPTESHVTVPRHLGTPRMDVVKALALAADLEDEAIARRLSEGR